MKTHNHEFTSVKTLITDVERKSSKTINFRNHNEILFES